MKKFLAIILLGLLWCNIGYAFNLKQKNYNCLENDSSLKNEIKIIKEYNSEYLLSSENSGYGEVLSFMKVSKDSLTSYTMELKWDVVHVSTLKSLKGSTEFIVYTYRLSEDQLNQIKPLKSKFSDTSNITTFELTEKELKNEVSIYNKITEILSLSKKEVVGDPLIYICNNGKEKTSKSNNSKPPVELINAMKQGCMGDNPYEKRKNFCICYGDWFYENLNNDEFDKFIYSSKEDKIKFLERNNIVKTCDAVSIFDLEKQKGGIIKKLN